MAVTIQTISDTTLIVNKKQVVKDIDGDWIANIELTTSEYKALQLHLNSDKTLD